MNVGQLEVLALHKYIGREGRMEDGGTEAREGGSGYRYGGFQKDSYV